MLALDWWIYVLVAHLAHGLWYNIFILHPVLRDVEYTYKIFNKEDMYRNFFLVWHIIFFLGMTISTLFTFWSNIKDVEKTKNNLYKHVIEG